MHECYVLAPEDFFRKLDDSLRINKNVIISRIFFTRPAYRNEKLSTDEEEKLILDGWQHFLAGVKQKISAKQGKSHYN